MGFIRGRFKKLYDVFIADAARGDRAYDLASRWAHTKNGAMEAYLFKDEMKCRALSAIHTLTDNEALAKTLKSARSRISMRGAENGDGFIGVARYSRRKNVVMAECRRLIAEQEPSYDTDADYEQAPLDVPAVKNDKGKQEGEEDCRSRTM